MLSRLSSTTRIFRLMQSLARTRCPPAARHARPLASRRSRRRSGVFRNSRGQARTRTAHVSRLASERRCAASNRSVIRPLAPTGHARARGSRPGKTRPSTRPMTRGVVGDVAARRAATAAPPRALSTRAVDRRPLRRGRRARRRARRSAREGRTLRSISSGPSTTSTPLPETSPRRSRAAGRRTGPRRARRCTSPPISLRVARAAPQHRAAPRPTAAQRGDARAAAAPTRRARAVGVEARQRSASAASAPSSATRRQAGIGRERDAVDCRSRRRARRATSARASARAPGR